MANSLSPRNPGWIRAYAVDRSASGGAALNTLAAKPPPIRNTPRSSAAAAPKGGALSSALEAIKQATRLPESSQAPVGLCGDSIRIDADGIHCPAEKSLPISRRKHSMACYAEFGYCHRHLTTSSSIYRKISEPHDLRIHVVLLTDWKPQCTGHFVFRLDRKPGEGRTCLAIDGDISTQCIAVIETCCDEAMADGKPVDLFLRDVISVDESGRALLCRLAAKGVRLLGNGVYTSYLVKSLQPSL